LDLSSTHPLEDLGRSAGVPPAHPNPQTLQKGQVDPVEPSADEVRHALVGEQRQPGPPAEAGHVQIPLLAHLAVGNVRDEDAPREAEAR